MHYLLYSPATIITLKNSNPMINWFCDEKNHLKEYNCCSSNKVTSSWRYSINNSLSNYASHKKADIVIYVLDMINWTSFSTFRIIMRSREDKMQNMKKLEKQMQRTRFGRTIIVVQMCRDLLEGVDKCVVWLLVQTFHRLPFNAFCKIHLQENFNFESQDR